MTRILSIFLVLFALSAVADSYSRIEPAMAEYIAKKQISGSVTIVLKDGKVVHHTAIGKADIAANKPMEKNSIFRIASLTKTVTSTALLMLQDEGKLSVEDPVSTYIPAFADCKMKDGSAVTVTIRDLMTHTSGIGRPKSLDGGLAVFANEVATMPIAWKPGSKWKYGSGPTVCGRIIELASGKPYDVFLNERIFTPLQMTDTSFHPQGEQVKRVVVTYQPSKDKKDIIPSKEERLRQVPTTKPVPNPSGGLYSTTKDLGIFYQMILKGGEYKGKRIISAAAVKQMTTRQTADSIVTGFTPGNGWGLGWCVLREPQGVTAMLAPGTYGHGGAYGTQAWVDPDKNAIFILMINRTKFGNSDGADIRGTFQRLAVEAMK